MPHRDINVAIKQAITLALNATQGHKRSYQQAITSALNVTFIDVSYSWRTGNKH